MARFSDRLNLEKQVTFYLSYHNNKVNQLIHLVCIWPIFVSGLVILAHTQSLIEAPECLTLLPFGRFLILNYSAVVTGIYMFWFIALDMFAGSFGATIVFFCYVLANYMVIEGTTLTRVPIMHVALAIQAIGWILQFVGHGVFERRAPALFDSPDQAFITAPLFVLLEVLFPLGYRPELYEHVTKQSQINVKKFHASKETVPMY